MRNFISSALLMMAFCISSHADTVVWSGTVESNGSPTAAIPMIFKETYQIKVSGVINLGKWVQNQQELANDACYEYSKEGTPARYVSIKNSLDISVCDGKYHNDHVYQSIPFAAEQNKIHFWVHDVDYEDNTGTFQVQLIHLSDK